MRERYDAARQLFDDRHGDGAFLRLTTLLGQPCMTFAAIAAGFGVTRERVRQWHLQHCPEAPRGHERQRLCALQRSKRDLLRQPLFRTFYRHARAHFAPGRFALIAGRDGFLKRSVRLDGRTVSIRSASLKYRHGVTAIYGLSGGAAAVDFLYYRLTDDDFLFVPRAAVPGGGASYRPGGGSRFERFHNTFTAAASGDRPVRPAPFLDAAGDCGARPDDSRAVEAFSGA